MSSCRAGSWSLRWASDVTSKSTRLRDQGFALINRILDAGECDDIAASMAKTAVVSVGSRNLLALNWCRRLARCLRSDRRLRPLLPASYVAVQCTYFEKSRDRNWLVALHQDLSIPVAHRVDDSSLRGWSEKEGSIFVQPPTALLERIIVFRLHIDRCGAEDGPLHVVPGSHRYGRVTTAEAIRLRSELPLVPCTLERGDVLAMRPLLLHQSSKATGTSVRRVLHFLFAPAELPCGLTWKLAF